MRTMPSYLKSIRDGVYQQSLTSAATYPVAIPTTSWWKARVRQAAESLLCRELTDDEEQAVTRMYDHNWTLRPAVERLIGRDITQAEVDQHIHGRG